MKKRKEVITSEERAMILKGLQEQGLVPSASASEKVPQKLKPIIPLEPADKMFKLLKDSKFAFRETERWSYHLVNTNAALALAIEAENELKPKNILERMLIHQMVSSHFWGMTMLSQLNLNNGASLELKASNNNIAFRLMTAFQNGLLTLEKLRHGGKQEVIVQHVHVNGDAQAVVAGKMDYKPTPKKNTGGDAPGGEDEN